jgi:site-specific DNA-cytosine methylase
MREPNDENVNRPLRVGSLFSGYGGLDLAVEEVFDARTVWFSEINEPVARTLARTGPMRGTSETSPPSTGAPSSPWTSGAVGPPVRTSPRSGRWQA